MRRKSNTMGGKKLFHVLACASRRCGIDNDLRCHISSVIVRCCLCPSQAYAVCGPTRRVADSPGSMQNSTPPATPFCLLSYKATLWSSLQGQAQNTAPWRVQCIRREDTLWSGRCSVGTLQDEGQRRVQELWQDALTSLLRDK